MDVAIFCLVMLVVVSPTYTLKGDNICKKTVTTESGELETKKICCKDFEEQNDKCVECSPGIHGWNCAETCPYNYYGRKCSTKCNCDNETQICHPVCGCFQRLDLNSSNMTNNNTSISLDNVTSLSSAEECPTTITTIDMLSTSTEPHSDSKDASTDETNSKISFLVGAASVTVLCIVFGIGLLYRLHLMRKKQECRVHHNMVYDLGDTSRIRENSSVRDDPAEPLYGECSYEDTCYSTLVLRVNNESGWEPNTSRQPVLTDDDNIYEFAYRYTHHSDEGQPPNV